MTKKAKAVLGFIIIFFYCTGITFAGPVLAVRDFHTREAMIAIPMEYGRQFTIRYIHSVDRSPVFEVFRADREHGLILVETYFRMFGAGMGHWQGHGTIVQDGEWIKIKDIEKPIGGFVLRIGSKGVDHTIFTDSRSVNLSEIGAGRLVELSMENKGKSQ